MVVATRSPALRYLRLGIGCVMVAGSIVWALDVFGFPGKLRRGVNEAIRNTEGVLRLDTVTTFDWDEVSVIGGHGDREKASQCLGFTATDDAVTGEDIATVVFARNRAIARSYRSPRPPFLYPLVPFQPGPCRVSRERASFKVTLDADGRHQLVLIERR
jgi:hypothetical protein